MGCRWCTLLFQLEGCCLMLMLNVPTANKCNAAPPPTHLQPTLKVAFHLTQRLLDWSDLRHTHTHTHTLWGQVTCAEHCRWAFPSAEDLQLTFEKLAFLWELLAVGGIRTIGGSSMPALLWWLPGLSCWTLCCWEIKTIVESQDHGGAAATWCPKTGDAAEQAAQRSCCASRLHWMLYFCSSAKE